MKSLERCLRRTPPGTIPPLDPIEAAAVLLEGLVDIRPWWPKTLRFPDFLVRSTIARNCFLSPNRRFVVHDEGLADISVAIGESLLLGKASSTVHVTYSFVAEQLVLRSRTDLAVVLGELVYSSVGKPGNLLTSHDVDSRLFREIFAREDRDDLPFSKSVCSAAMNGSLYRVGRLAHVCHELGHYIAGLPESIHYFERAFDLPDFITENEESLADLLAVALTCGALHNAFDFSGGGRTSLIVAICIAVFRITRTLAEISAVVANTGRDAKGFDSLKKDFRTIDDRFGLTFAALRDAEVMQGILRWATGREDFDEQVVDHFYWYSGVVCGAVSANSFWMLNALNPFVAAPDSELLSELRQINEETQTHDEVRQALIEIRKRMGQFVVRTVSPFSHHRRPPIPGDRASPREREELLGVKYELVGAGIYLQTSSWLNT